MRLLYFKYNNSSFEHPLNGFEQDFRELELLGAGLNPICLVGVNGSGKSKLLECLAEVLGYVLSSYSEFMPRPKNISLDFKLEYAIRKNSDWKFVRIESPLGVKAPTVSVGSDEDNLKELRDSDKILEFFPKTVIGYTSGENESLSDWFSPYRDQYAEFYMSSAFGTQRNKQLTLPVFPHFLWVDYSMNRLVFIANSVLGLSKNWTVITDEVHLKRLRSFRIVYKEKPKGGPSKGIVPAQAQRAIFDQLRECATAYESRKEEKTVILDFYINDATISAFKKYFKTSYNLYVSLLQLELLNHVLIRSELDEMKRSERNLEEKIDRPEILSTRRAFNISQIKVLHDNADTFIDYTDLSDGEHQFMHVFGTLLMAEDDNILFLLDEPETHFNPQWRAAFISMMTKIVDKRFQEFLITTHSPFLLSDSKSDNVFIFDKEKDKINITKPEIQTYGAAIDRLLKIAFKVAPPVAFKSRDELQGLIKNKTRSIESLEKAALEFGDSIEKLYLYQKIEGLKAEKKRKLKK